MKKTGTASSLALKSVFIRVVGAIALCGWALLAGAEPRPLVLSEDYYPLESRRLHEEGVCVVKITVTADGAVEDPTLTKSTGYTRLDDACVAAFRGQRMKPAIRGGKPTAVTAELPVVWNLKSAELERIRINPDHLPRIGVKHYPTESIRFHEEGVCVVQVAVSAAGKVTVLGLTHSTGFPRLDQACLGAYSDGDLLPATVKGAAIDSTAEFPIAWRLGDAKPVD